MTLKAASLREDNITNSNNKKIGDEANGTALTTSSNGEQWKGKQDKGKSKRNSDTSKVKCHVCMKLGHFSWECPKVKEFIKSEHTKNEKTMEQSSSITAPSSNANATASIAKTNDVAWALFVNPNRYEHLSVESIEDPVIDSGTT